MRGKGVKEEKQVPKRACEREASSLWSDRKISQRTAGKGPEMKRSGGGQEMWRISRRKGNREGDEGGVETKSRRGPGGGDFGKIVEGGTRKACADLSRG